MILDAMLQRLYQGLLKGPGLNARPHNSRQRLDLAALGNLGGAGSEGAIRELLDGGKLEVSASVTRFTRPEYPEAEWSDEQRAHRDAWDAQTKLLRKLSAIATDAKEYFNDHGEEALFVGYPLISIPPDGDKKGFGTSRVVAPLAMIPVGLKVRASAKPGVTITTTGEGGDRVVPNPALLAWIERMTGEVADDLFADEEGEKPWEELESIFEFVARGIGLKGERIDRGADLVAVPKSDGLPDAPELLNAAVLGLFPMRNPGMIRDTQWMMEVEDDLTGPVRHFLKREAIFSDSPGDLPPAEALSVGEQASFVRDFSREFLITRADPCQTAAVESAAISPALVIHGPPGTGKSQTIANIISDHLARGERVLFVCDKRTALDVVKYRLDALGIGHLCGVIHDPQRDRKDLYMGMRGRLEELVDQDLPLDRMPALEQVNQRLNALHGELREAYQTLHGEQEGESFHALVGRWMALGHEREVTDGAAAITPALVEQNKATVIELCERAGEASLSDNPLFECLNFGLAEYFSAKPGDFEDRLRKVAPAFTLPGDGRSLPSLPDSELLATAENRHELARLVAGYSELGNAGVAERILAAADGSKWRASWDDLLASAEMVERPLDRELSMQTKGQAWTIGSINQSLVALRDYLDAMGAWTKLFAFGKKKAAGGELAKLGLQLGVDQANRAVEFLEGVKGRLLLDDFLSSIRGRDGSPVLAGDDDALRADLASVRLGFELCERIELDSVIAASSLKAELVSGRAGAWSEELGVSGDRARAIVALSEALTGAGLMKAEPLATWFAAFRTGSSGSEFGKRYGGACEDLEKLLRAEDCLARLPEEIRAAGRSIALAETDPEQAAARLEKTALGNEVRAKLDSSPDLARIDTVRIEAIFSELGERIVEKQALVREVVVRYWQERQSMRVLASTGNRLSSVGASLRQRLYVRGKKALRLRQMIAAGNDVEGGDPLFDLCPVWMASPDTVAQIFPREAVFDVAIFDEASQCRLEEALPVLLRAKRLVVAGDPKQLPPTRFFEGALAESDGGEIETEEDLHAHQMTEMEDLLGAALNLDVAEAFLDVHYRSRNEALIGFSNDSFYGSRLQPIPGHPKNKALSAPVRLTNVDGVYKEQSNPSEALAVVDKVRELLDDSEPPSIGIATFNVKQRNLILELLDEAATSDREFASRLSKARARRGSDSFEGLFVKNLENVQGDERDVMIVSTTFGRDEEGKFRRNFGALSRVGGERRLNVLVTRARSEVLVMTSIPREEYQSGLASAGGSKPNGRHFLYAYLCYAERLAYLYEKYNDELEAMKTSELAACEVLEVRQPSLVAESLGGMLCTEHGIGSTVHWGNDGFMVDAALTHPQMPEDVTLGVVADFNRYRNTPDPIDWELFRSAILRGQGWQLERVWSPRLFRDLEAEGRAIADRHRECLCEQEAFAEENVIPERP